MYPATSLGQEDGPGQRPAKLAETRRTIILAASRGRPDMRQILIAAAFAAFAATPAWALDKSEKAMIAAVDKHTAEAEALLEKLVNINSGTMNLKGVEAVSVVMREQLESLGFKVRWVPMMAVGRAGTLVAEHPGKGKRMLLIGHMDTVCELSSPFQT